MGFLLRRLREEGNSTFSKLIYLPVIGLILYFLYRLWDQSKMIFMFPLDYTNDISSYMTMLHFLGQYGYHQIVLNWYYPQGIMLFDVYGPGWAFFVYPLLKLLGDVKIASYASLIIMYFLGFLAFWWIGKTQRFSKFKTFLFYIFFFASPMAIGDYIRQMRLPQMLGWILFLFITILLFKYKNKKIDWKIFLISPLFALLIITHSAETILLSTLFLGFILIKKDIKEWFLVSLSFLIGVILAAPWLYTFFKRSSVLFVKEFQKLSIGWITDFSGGFKFANIAGIFIALALLAVFFIYILSIKRKYTRRKEILFFLPMITLIILYQTRIVVFIPLFNKIAPDVMTQFMGFFTLFFFFKINLENVGQIISKGYKTLLFLIPIIFILVSIYHTPFFIEPNEEEIESLEILNYVEKPYMVIGKFPDRLFSRAIICYGSIYHDLYSVGGWAQIQATTEHLDNLKLLDTSLRNNDCKNLIRAAELLQVEELITHGEEQCNVLKECGFEHKIDKGELCLFENGM